MIYEELQRIPLLKPISPFLQGMQEGDEERMVGKCVLFITGDTVEGSNPSLITKPYGIAALFHKPLRY